MPIIKACVHKTYQCHWNMLSCDIIKACVHKTYQCHWNMLSCDIIKACVHKTYQCHWNMLSCDIIKACVHKTYQCHWNMLSCDIIDFLLCAVEVIIIIWGHVMCHMAWPKEFHWLLFSLQSVLVLIVLSCDLAIYMLMFVLVLLLDMLCVFCLQILTSCLWE